MNALTDIQYLHDETGAPTFAVLPVSTFKWLTQKAGLQNPLETGVPSDVVGLVLKHQYSAVRAWREYLGLTQIEVAQRLGISQSAYSQHENSQTLRKSTRLKIAEALGIHPEQLDF